MAKNKQVVSAGYGAPGAAVPGATVLGVVLELDPDIKDVLAAIRLANTRDDLTKIIAFCAQRNPGTKHAWVYDEITRAAIHRLLAHVN